jgi:hypothetical protein
MKEKWDEQEREKPGQTTTVSNIRKYVSLSPFFFDKFKVMLE